MHSTSVEKSKNLCKIIYIKVVNIGERRIAMEDKKIIQLLFARAENAISELSIRFGKQLFRIAYNILENQLD